MRGRGREAHRDDQLLRREDVGVGAREEVLRGHDARAVDAAHHDARAEREAGQRQLARRVGLGQRAAERAAVADLRVADVAHDVLEHGQALGDHRRGARAPRSGRARRPRPPGRGRRFRPSSSPSPLTSTTADGRISRMCSIGHEALPAGEHASHAEVLVQHPDRVVDRRRPQVLERRGLHEPAAPPVMNLARTRSTPRLPRARDRLGRPGAPDRLRPDLQHAHGAALVDRPLDVLRGARGGARCASPSAARRPTSLLAEARRVTALGLHVGQHDRRRTPGRSGAPAPSSAISLPSSSSVTLSTRWRSGVTSPDDDSLAQPPAAFDDDLRAVARSPGRA